MTRVGGKGSRETEGELVRTMEDNEGYIQLVLFVFVEGRVAFYERVSLYVRVLLFRYLEQIRISYQDPLRILSNE